jgi:hypothetical protein
MSMSDWLGKILNTGAQAAGTYYGGPMGGQAAGAASSQITGVDGSVGGDWGGDTTDFGNTTGDAAAPSGMSSSLSDPSKWLDAASGVGNYLSGMTKTTPQSSTGGFSGYPKEVQDFMLKILFPKIQGLASAYRPTGMMRQYTAEEANDPIFGSKALAYMQERKNQEVAPSIISQLTQQNQQSAPATQPTQNPINTSKLQSLGLI